jgi:hypothetical protein
MFAQDNRNILSRLKQTSISLRAGGGFLFLAKGMKTGFRT